MPSSVGQSRTASAEVDMEEYDELFARREELLELKERLSGEVVPQRGFEMGTYLKHIDLLSDYSTLPSFDLTKRLGLAGKFHPQLQITDVVRQRTHSGLSLSFKAAFSKVVSFELELSFEGNKMRRLTITRMPGAGVTAELDQIDKLALYAEAATDTTVFFTAMSSYVRLCTTREQLWMDLFDKYYDECTAINGMTTSRGGRSRLLAYSLFHNSTSFDCTTKSSRNHLFLNWQLFIPTTDPAFVGECRSDVTASSDTVNLTDSVDTLIRTNGAYEGCSRLISTVL